MADYCRHAGRASIEGWPFYVAFAMFRLAAISQGIAGRVRDGTAAGADAAERGARAPLLAARAKTPEQAIARMDRALREFRVRGVSTNIDFVINLLKHPTFLDNTYTTKFIDTTPALFAFRKRRDRATKILTYIADITVNGHPETAGRPKPPADQAHDLYLAMLEPDQMFEAHVNLIHHGRAICHARRPECDRCPVLPRCRYVDRRAP